MIRPAGCPLPPGETLAARLVDLPVDESTKRPFHVYLGDGDEDHGESEPFTDALDELEVLERLAAVDRWACLYGGAALVLDVDDGQPPHMPVRETSIRSVRGIRVVDRYELQRASYYVAGDEAAPGVPVPLQRVGTAKTYYLTPHGHGAYAILGPNGRTAAVATGMQVIHESRVIPFVGFEVPPRLLEQRDGWGQPVLERYIDRLLATAAADKAISHILNEWRIAIMAIKGLRQIVQAPDGSKQLAARMMAFNMSKGITGLAVLDADGETFSQQGAPVTGLADLYDRTCQSLSAISGIPVTLLYGQAPKGLTTDNEGGRTSWYDMVESRQRRRYRRPIRRICRLLQLAKDGVDVAEDAIFRVEFEPLLTPSETESAEARKLQAEVDEKYFDLGVLSPDEIRASRFGGPGHSWDTRLQADAAPVPPPMNDGNPPSP